VGAPPRFAQSLQCSFGLKHRILDLRHAPGGRSRCLTQDVPQGSVFSNAVFPTPASPRTTRTPLRSLRTPATTHQTRRTRDAARAAPSEPHLAACPVHEERAFSQEASLVVESVCELRIAAEEAVEPVFDLGIDASSAPLRVDVQRRLPVGVAGLCLHEDEVSSGFEGERDEGPTESVRRDSRGQGASRSMALRVGAALVIVFRKAARSECKPARRPLHRLVAVSVLLRTRGRAPAPVRKRAAADRLPRRTASRALREGWWRASCRGFVFRRGRRRSVRWQWRGVLGPR
jgi:hypothetical protein